jgi:hypothetical protein
MGTFRKNVARKVRPESWNVINLSERGYVIELFNFPVFDRIPDSWKVQ